MSEDQKSSSQVVACSIPRYGLFLGHKNLDLEDDFGFDCLVAASDELDALLEKINKSDTRGFWWHIVDFSIFGIVMKDTDLETKNKH